MLGLLDAFLGAGDEVPPEVARSVQRFTTEQHGLQRRLGTQPATGAGFGNDEMLGGQIDADDFDNADAEETFPLTAQMIESALVEPRGRATQPSQKFID